MSTTDELLETTEGPADISAPADVAVVPEAEELEIPEDFFQNINDEEFIADGSEDSDMDTDMFAMDFSDVEKEEAREAERAAKERAKEEAALLKKVEKEKREN